MIRRGETPAEGVDAARVAGVQTASEGPAEASAGRAAGQAAKADDDGAALNGQRHGVGTRGFAVILFGAMLGGLTQTAMNTVLPDCMPELGITVGQGQWLVNVYALCLGIVIPVYAFLSRRHSTKTLFLAALAVYTAGTLVVDLTSSFSWMFAGRVLEGCAAGIMFPLVQTVALTDFPQDRRALVMGFVGLAMGFAPNIGPTLAGAFATYLGWRSVFLFLTVLAVVDVVLGLFLVPRSDVQPGERKPLDLLSLVLSTAGFGSLLTAFSNLSSYDLESAQCWGPFVVGVVALVWFCRRETRIDNPMLDVTVFKNRDFSLGTVMICALFGAFIGVTVLIPMYVQEVLGATALQSGMVLLPGVLAALVVNPLSGWLMGRVGVRPVVRVASVLLVAGTVGLIDMGQMDDLVMIAFWQGVRSFGISGLIMPITTWSLNTLAPKDMADGTSGTYAVRQVAAALGTSVIVLLMEEGVHGGSVTPAGTDAAMAFSLAMSAVVLVMAYAFIRNDRV